MEHICIYQYALKKIIDNHFEKEVVFINDIEIYSREHCHCITPDELCEWAIEITMSKDDDYSGETL